MAWLLKDVPNFSPPSRDPLADLSENAFKDVKIPDRMFQDDSPPKETQRIPRIDVSNVIRHCSWVDDQASAYFHLKRLVVSEASLGIRGRSFALAAVQDERASGYGSVRR